MKLREKTTATLLIAIFMISTMAFSVPIVSAQGEITNLVTLETFATIQLAIDDTDTKDGHTLSVDAGNWYGALVDKSVQIIGTDGATINDGPVHRSGLIQGFRMLAGSDGAVISHLRFEDIDLVIMNAAAVDGVTISHNTIVDSIQGVSNWGGSGWKIVHNTIIDLRTDCGGGIGIFIGDYTGGVVKDNIVSHNRISGTLYVKSGDCGGYEGCGIVLYADFRWGALGALAIKDNYVTHNKVSLVSNNTGLVDVVAFELTDTRNDTSAAGYPVLKDNLIGFNDFRGTVKQIALTPTDLENRNTISRNLGDNRGQATVHPTIFNPN